MTESFPDRIRIQDTYMVGRVRWFILATRFRQFTSHSTGTIIVPAGFHTDGASIPRAFHTIIGPYGPYFGAAIIHDYLYSKAAAESYPHITRKIADQIFDEGMYNLGVPWRHRAPMYRAVRMFGSRSYQKR